jgi:DNA-binding NtrC family response regulator
MTDTANILIVDDDPTMRDACGEVLRRAGCTFGEAESGTAALEALARGRFDLVLLDLRLPGRSGMDVLDWIRDRAPGTAVVIITGHGTIDLAVDAMKRGAADFLRKPFTPEMLREAMGRALTERRAARAAAPAEERAPADRVPPLVGRSAAMRQIQALVDRVAPGDSAVLITGEPGTGKEIVARTIRKLSPRRDKPFVAVDCEALAGPHFESELFGRVAASPAGPGPATYGRLESANGGTIFFDEIADLEPQIQARLLRLMQEREFVRLGSAAVVPIDVRVLAATSRDLSEEIRAGRFREDLYYRLCAVSIVLPPLRQRVDDIAPLAEHFLAEFNRRPGRRLRFCDEAMGLLLAHGWPGNVRELRNTVERAVILARGDEIQPADLSWIAGAAGAPDALSTRLDDVERDHIERVLRECGGNRSAAARALGIDRKTLWRKLKASPEA